MVFTNPPKKRFRSNCVTMEKNKSINLCDVAQHNLYCTNKSLSFDETAVPTAERGSAAIFLKLLFSTDTYIYLCDDK